MNRQNIFQTITALLLVVFFFPVTGFGQQGYSIKGILKKHNGSIIFLSYRDGKTFVQDSTLVKAGHFKFTGTVPHPAPATLSLKGNGSDQTLHFFLGNEQITVTAGNAWQTATVKGASLNDAYQQYLKYIAASEDAITAVSTDYRNAPESQQKDPAFREGLDARYAKAAAEKEVAQLRYIREKGDPYFSFIALREMISRSTDQAQIESAFNSLPATARSTEDGKALAEEITTARLTAIGSIAPDFTQNDVNDQPLSLSSFRGKYVLLDFWASWCGPCRAENPNLVNLYAKYKGSNFTVFGISLDRPGKKDAWLEAIKADGLTWPQASDLQFWNNAVAKQYGIKFIPQNLLIDPQGKIIAKNLRGKALAARLKELFAN